MKIRVARTFVPPEAAQIAAEFNKAANDAINLSNQLSNISGTLESTWEGNSKNSFMGDFSPEPGNLRSYAQYLRNCAHQISQIRVTVWEWQEVEDPIKKA